MHCLCFWLIVLTSTCLWLMTGVLPLVAANALGSPGLFNSDENVKAFDGAEFKRWLGGGVPVKVVMFYAHWCGHCRRFAPVYKELAADVTGWQSIMEVGAINCANVENNQLCRDNDIAGFPTIKFFWIQRGGIGSTSGAVIDSRTPAGMENDIVDLIEKNIKEKGSPQGSPNLAPSSADTLQGIWDSVPSNLKHLFAVVEKPESYVGRKLILDFSTNKTAAVVRLLRGSGPEELRNQDSVSLVLLERGVHPRLLATEKDREKAREVFKEQLKNFGFYLEKNITRVSTTQGPPVVIGNYSRVYLDDLEAGIAYCLKQEVALKNVITQRQLSILKKFIQLIYENIDLPLRIRDYLEKVSKRIHVAGPLNGADFPRLLKSAETKKAYLSQNVDYVGCRGSSPGKRGYTCALWTVFHFITVGNHARYLEKKVDNPNLAVLVIKDYIQNFFSCSDCAAHFSKMSENIENELTNPNESVLWLWRGHNKVNARLSGDVTEDPERPKLQFPPPSLCQECHAGDAFNELAVLQFLHRFYSKDNLVSSENLRTTEAAAFVTEAANAKYFSGFDLTIFLVIYAVSITLLFVVFVAMVCRRRKGNFNKNFSFLH